MNTETNPTQSNTKPGLLELIAFVALIGLEGYLWKIIDNAGVPSFTLPGAVTDLAIYIGAAGAPAGAPAFGEVPQDGNFRVKAYGTGSAGDILILADPTANAGAQAGMARSFVGSQAPVAPGEYFAIGIAEEDFVDGQLVMARFVPKMVRIKSTFVPSGVEATDIAAIKTILEAQGLVA